MIYRTHVSIRPITSPAYCPYTVWYQVTGMRWLLYYGHLAEFEYGKYRSNHAFLGYASAEHQVCFTSVSKGFLERLRTMGRPNSPDRTPKRKKLSDQNWLQRMAALAQKKSDYQLLDYKEHSTWWQFLLIQPSSATSERLLENSFGTNQTPNDINLSS